MILCMEIICAQYFCYCLQGTNLYMQIVIVNYNLFYLLGNYVLFDKLFGLDVHKEKYIM